MPTKNIRFLRSLQTYCLLISLVAAVLSLSCADSTRAQTNGDKPNKSAALYTLEWELVGGNNWGNDWNDKAREQQNQQAQQNQKAQHGEKRLLIITFTPQAGYYIYGNDSQEQGKPTRLGLWMAKPDSAPGSAPISALAEALYPPAHSKPDLLNPGFTSFIYDQSTSFLLTLPDSFTPPPSGLTLTFSALLCSAHNCTPLEESIKIPATAFDNVTRLDEAGLQARLPGLADFKPGKTMSLPRSLKQNGGGRSAAADPAGSLDRIEKVENAEKDGQSAPDAAEAAHSLTPEYYRPGLEVNSINKAILLGFLAGFILNFMPCVLPVLSIKISGLLYYSGNDEHDTRVKSFRQHCLYFAAGIMTWFFTLGLLLLKGGMVWGQMFQYPLLVMALTALIFSLSLSLFGVFNLPVLDLKHSHSSRNPRLQAFLAGLLATLLATPCSGPLLGGVLGWSFQKSPLIVFVVLSSVGLGMSSLYLVLATWPQLVRRLPRPGAWMSNVAQFVAFILMGSALWLLSSIPQNRLMDSLVLLLVVALACWLWGRLVTLNTTRVRRLVSATLIIMLAAGAFWQWNKIGGNEVQWEPFTQALFEESLGNEAMLITFTADWCPNCKALERAVLTLDKIAALKKRYGLRTIKVDLTNPNPDGEALLKQLGSNSIPLLAIFRPGPNAGTPLIIRDLFTEHTLDSALNEALNR